MARKPTPDQQTREAGTSIAVGAVLIFFLVLFFGNACSSSDNQRQPTSSSPTYTSTAPQPSSPSTTTTTPSNTQNVARVVDGDTLEMKDGTKVRVLGIDSCEMSTPAGEDAKARASILALSMPVELDSIGTDRYGRTLAYVKLHDDSDFGERMVTYAHTAVYGGRNDASPEYVARLRELDAAGEPNSCAVSSVGGYVFTEREEKHDHDDENFFCNHRWWC